MTLHVHISVASHYKNPENSDRKSIEFQMGFLGFLKFALKCFDFLAWPLFALGFPLYASIRAIETNSYSDMQNLVAYWILFSLISLFELAFVILIDWLPFWPYMKLIAVFWLVLPHFSGAAYVYECLLRPCLSVDPRVVLKHLIKPKEDKSLNAESFLAVAERYVQENGSEALEKLLDGKSKHTKPEIDVEEIKAVTTMAGKETAAATQSKFEEPPSVAKEDTRALELTEKNPVAATKWIKVKEPNDAKENADAGELKDKNPAVATETLKRTKPDIEIEETKAVTMTEGKETAPATQSKFKEPPAVAKEDARAVVLTEKNPVAETKWIEVKEPNVSKQNADAGELKDKNPAVATEPVKCIDPNPAQTEKKTVAAVETKEKTVVAAGGGNEAVEVTASEKVQKEWTCALCQVTTTCENNLNMHLHGGKHKARCKELKASKQVTKNKVCSSSAANQVPKKPVHIDRPNQSKPKKQEDKVQGKRVPEHLKEREVRNTGFGMNQSSFWCSLCDVKCTGESDLASHFGGRKHLFQLQQHMADSFGGGFY